MKEQTKEKQMELQMLDMQARQISEQLEKIDSSIMEIEYLKNSLGELKTFKEGVDVLAPVGNGIFAKAKLQENDRLLLNVGNNIVVEKSVSETQKLLSDRVAEIAEVREKMVLQLQKIEERLIELDHV
jgi:prefoldin alpha subunit